MRKQKGGRGDSVGDAEGGGKPRSRKVHHKGEERQYTDEDELRAMMGELSTKNDDSDSDTEAKQRRPKGVTALMETANVNRDGEQVAAHIKASELDVHSKPQLSRREREAIEKERKRKNYQEAYAQGKTPEAQAQLARLAQIRAEREAATKRREEEINAKEEAKQAARERAQKGRTSKYL